MGFNKGKQSALSNEAQILIKEIQYKTGKSLEQIAGDIGYTRPYLNNVKLNGGGKKVVDLLKHKYRNVLQSQIKVKDLSPGPDASLLELMRHEMELQQALTATKKRIEKMVKG